MKVYQRKEARLGKWIVAAIAFLVVMTVTFADAYGVGVPSKPGDSGRKNQDPPPATIQSQSDMRTPGFTQSVASAGTVDDDPDGSWSGRGRSSEKVSEG